MRGFFLSVEERQAIATTLNQLAWEERSGRSRDEWRLVAGVLRRLREGVSSAASVGPRVPEFVMRGLKAMRELCRREGWNTQEFHLQVAVTALESCGVVAVPNDLTWSVRDATAALDKAGIAWAWEDEAERINAGVVPCDAITTAAEAEELGKTMPGSGGVQTTSH